MFEPATAGPDLVGELIEHRPERKAVAIAGGDHVGEAAGPCTEVLGERGQCIGEGPAPLGSSHDLGERTADRRLVERGEVADPLDRGESGPQLSTIASALGERPVEAAHDAVGRWRGAVRDVE